MTAAEEEMCAARGRLLCRGLLQYEVVDEVRGGRALRAGAGRVDLGLEGPPAPDMSR